MAVLCVDILPRALLLTLLYLGEEALGWECHLNVTTPQSLDALTGSCVQIPCNFTTPNSTKSTEAFNASNPVFGVWMKGGHNFDTRPAVVIFNSSEQNNYLINITGDLKKKDCTTVFYNLTTNTDKYFFRIENRPYLATASCNGLTIKVTDSPQAPYLKVSGNQTENETLTITCSAVAPCPIAPPKLTLDQHTTNITKMNPDTTFNITMEKEIRLTDSHDRQVVRCSAAYPVSGREIESKVDFTLNVTYGPKNTSVQVSPSGPLSAGQTVTLRCTSKANPPVKLYTWFRLSPADSVGYGDTYSFNLTEDGDYYCVASNVHRNHSSQIITLRITEPIPWEVILGIGIGLLLVVCLVSFVWFLRSQYRASKETQGERFEQPDKAGEEEQSVHYGEIDFSKFNLRVVPDTEREETVYSEVQMKKPETAESSADVNELYATVVKKQ